MKNFSAIAKAGVRTKRFNREIRGGKVVYVPLPSTPGPRGGRLVFLPPLSCQWLIPLQLPLAIALLLAAAVTTLGISWFGYTAIVNPDLYFWLEQAFPGRSGFQTSPGQPPPQPLSQILAALEQAGKQPGEPLILESQLALRSGLEAATLVLVPIYQQQPDCNLDCEAITELQLYRALQIPSLARLFQAQPTWRLLERIPVSGPQETEVIVSAPNARLANYGSTRRLPLTQLEIDLSAPAPGTWLRLSGVGAGRSTPPLYGQIFHFNPEQARLNLVLTWHSPKGTAPTWQPVTGTPTPELVVDQGVALEPNFKVYQLQSGSRGAARLQAIALTQPSFPDSTYGNSLMLARRGLWTSALPLLQQVKQQQAQRWTPAAQAQLDLIQIHAQVTQAQALQPTPNPLERIVAYLNNGSWSAALQVLEANSSARSAVQEMLLADSGRLLKQVEATLSVNPGQPDALAWGAMLLSVQQGQPEAIAWLSKRIAPRSQVFKRIEKNLQRLHGIAPSTPSGLLDHRLN